MGNTKRSKDGSRTKPKNEPYKRKNDFQKNNWTAVVVKKPAIKRQDNGVVTKDDVLDMVPIDMANPFYDLYGDPVDIESSSEDDYDSQ
jgi:hypothetical protein